MWAPDIVVVTDRQAEILQLLAEGCSTGEIAHRLDLSHSTVRHHVERARRQLEARNHAHAVAIALRKGWIR